MKHVKLLLLVLALHIQAYAQWAQCDTMTIRLITDSIKFKDNIFSASDSIITLPFINNTSANFAYPQAKLINTTPLPAGMSLASSNWQVFASAWNIGDTATAAIEYDVTAPIPDNYTVTFKVYCKNFAPLAYDSCEFVNTITVNLKPVGITTVGDANGREVFSVYPNPATNVVYVTADEGSIVEVYSLTGQKMLITTISKGVNAVDVSGLASGVYFLRCGGEVRRVVKGG